MTWLVFAMFGALALFGPLFGADSRDGRDWAPAPWPEPRRTRMGPVPAGRTPRRERAGAVAPATPVPAASAPAAPAPAAPAPVRAVPAAPASVAFGAAESRRPVHVGR